MDRAVIGYLLLAWLTFPWSGIASAQQVAQLSAVFDIRDAGALRHLAPAPFAILRSHAMLAQKPA